MKKEVSDTVVISLLIVAIFVSIVGTVLVYESVQEFRENIRELGSKSYTTGMVSLYVPEEIVDEKLGDDLNENL